MVVYEWTVKNRPECAVARFSCAGKLLEAFTSRSFCLDEFYLTRTNLSSSIVDVKALIYRRLELCTLMFADSF